MKITFASLTGIVVIALFCTSLVAADSDSAEEFSVKGLTVILKRNPANEIISAQLYLRGGALNLTDATQGIESLLFSCALKGSKNYPKEKLNTILDKTAAQITTFSTTDYTAVSLRCIRRYFDETWDVFADLIVNPTFDPGEVELERDKLVLNIRQRKDNPDVYLQDMADDLFYQDHPYHLRPQGVEETMTDITIGQMRDYLNENLQTSKLVLVVVGDVDKNDLRRRVEATFGNLPKGDYTAAFPERVSQSSASLKIEERELPTNYILGRFSAPGPMDPDYYAMVMATNILQWRVWEEVRTKRNLSYAPSAFFSNRFSNFGGIYVTAVEPDTTIKVMFAELKRLQGEPVSQKDLQDRITMYLTRYYMNNETNAAQAQFLAWYELCGLGWEESENMVENLRKVTAEDVQRVARQYFKNIQFAVLGNPDLVDAALFQSM